MKTRNLLAAGALALFGLTACVDLDVENLNAPDAERALATAGDVESLISGSFRQWWNSNSFFGSMSPILTAASFQNSPAAANSGMVEYSGFPRPPVGNDPADQFYGNWNSIFQQNYRAVSAVVDGLVAVNEGQVTLSQETRARAFGYFVLGLAHATVAVNFDQGYIYDPEITREEVQEAGLQPYPEVMAAAQGYFDRAIQYAQQGSFTIPDSWMSRNISQDQLIELAYTYKARYLAASARTPQERENLDWVQIQGWLDNGITDTYQMNLDFTNWWSSVVWNLHRGGAWGLMSYHVLGMADQSGRYQEWMSLPVADRHPELPGGNFYIVTDDTRFPQGTTQQEQIDNPGTKYIFPASGALRAWVRPDRGEFRWSYYYNNEFDEWRQVDGLFDEIHIAEVDLLRAEGYYHRGQPENAVPLINQWRTANGLSATDASGTNDSCVPRLRDGTCGGLFEMLKWEKRLETQWRGQQAAPWYFDSRGWGDLAEGTFLSLPVPSGELQNLGVPVYTLGGVGQEGGAPVGTYGY